MNSFNVNGQLSIDTSNVFINGKQSDLNIVQLNYDQYVDLIKQNKCDANTIYLIEENGINMYGQPIRNVKDPVEGTDAVNMKYIEENYIRKSEISAYVKNEVRNVFLELLSEI